VGRIDEVRVSRIDRSTDGPGGTSTFGKTQVNYRYNARNQLTVEYAGPEVTGDPPSDVSVKTYSYDKNGNVTDIVETVGTVEVSNEHMEYDELNRMLSHTGPSGTESFTYRGAEWHRASANGKQFLYDGDNVLADIGTGGVEALYVTPFLDQNLSMTTSVGTYYYSQDGLGSVRTLTDSAGALVNSYDFLAFGGAYSPTTTVSLPQRYTYTGREKNPASALMYYRYRQYDPRIGRFGARDPLGYLGGVGLYSYVSARPAGRRDAFGLWGNPIRAGDAWARVCATVDEDPIMPLARKVRLNPWEAFGAPGWLRNEDKTQVNSITEIRANSWYVVPNTVALYVSKATWGDGVITFVSALRRRARADAKRLEGEGFRIITVDPGRSNARFIELWQEDGIWGIIYGGHGTSYGLKADPYADTVVSPRDVHPPYGLGLIHLYCCYGAADIQVNYDDDNPEYESFMRHLSIYGSFFGYTGPVNWLSPGLEYTYEGVAPDSSSPPASECPYPNAAEDWPLTVEPTLN